MDEVYSYRDYTTEQVSEALKDIDVCCFGPRCNRDNCVLAHILSSSDTSRRVPPKQKFCTFILTPQGCKNSEDECKFSHHLEKTTDGLCIRWYSEEQRDMFEKKIGLNLSS